jgi:acyl carrier protein
MPAPTQRFRVNSDEIITWLNEEGVVEIDADFPADGDLFAAGLDSMAVMQLVVAAEEKFGVILGPADITRENLATPAAMAALFSAKSS